MHLGKVTPLKWLPDRRGRVFAHDCFFELPISHHEDDPGAELFKELDILFTEHQIEFKGADRRHSYHECNHSCYIIENENKDILGFWYHDGALHVGTVWVDHHNYQANDISCVPWNKAMQDSDIAAY